MRKTHPMSKLEFAVAMQTRTKAFAVEVVKFCEADELNPHSASLTQHGKAPCRTLIH